MQRCRNVSTMTCQLLPIAVRSAQSVHRAARRVHEGARTMPPSVLDKLCVRFATVRCAIMALMLNGLIDCVFFGMYLPIGYNKRSRAS